MAPRFVERMTSRFRDTRQTSAPNPALPPASPSRPTSSPSETSSQSLQERLWNQAYDELKANEPDIVETYERILSCELGGSHSTSINSALQKNEIGQTLDKRWSQMEQLVRAGLKRTEKEAAVKREIEDGMQAVHSVRGIMDKAVQAAPQAALAWVGVCFALEILSNPVTEARLNRKGIAYVVLRMEWYWNLSDLLLDKNTAVRSTGLRVQLEKHVIDLYKKLLSYQMKSVCVYYRNRTVVFLRDMLKLDDWDGTLSDIKHAEATVRADSEQYNTQKIITHLQDIASTAASREMKLDDIHSAIREQTMRHEKMQEDMENKKCLKDLRKTDPRHDKERIEQTKGGLLKDSYRWILENPSYRT